MCRILITGLPGMGKTTLVRKISAELSRLHPTGFYTSEIREKGARNGFALVGLGGERGTLAHVDFRGQQRVGRYGVDIEGFDRFLDAITWQGRDVGLVVIDEIGKMECFSEKFQALVRRLLDSDVPLLATIASTGGGFIAEVKRRPDVELIEVTRGNRDALVGEIVPRFG